MSRRRSCAFKYVGPGVVNVEFGRIGVMAAIVNST
jgi:hypothetical protein